MKSTKVLNVTINAESKSELMNKIEELFENTSEKNTFFVGITGVTRSEGSTRPGPVRVRRSDGTFPPHSLQLLESLFEPVLKRENLCNDLDQILQEIHKYKQHPSEPTVENNGAPKFFSQEKRAFFYNRIAENRAQTATKDTYSARLGRCLCKCLVEYLEKDCAKL